MSEAKINKYERRFYESQTIEDHLSLLSAQRKYGFKTIKEQLPVYESLFDQHNQNKEIAKFINENYRDGMLSLDFLEGVFFAWKVAKLCDSYSVRIFYRGADQTSSVGVFGVEEKLQPFREDLIRNTGNVKEILPEGTTIELDDNNDYVQTFNLNHAFDRAEIIIQRRINHQRPRSHTEDNNEMNNALLREIREEIMGARFEQAGLTYVTIPHEFNHEMPPRNRRFYPVILQDDGEGQVIPRNDETRFPDNQVGDIIFPIQETRFDEDEE